MRPAEGCSSKKLLVSLLGRVVLPFQPPPFSSVFFTFSSILSAITAASFSFWVSSFSILFFLLLWATRKRR